MFKHPFQLLYAVTVLSFVIACTPPAPREISIGTTPLQDKYAPYFTIGAAVTPSKLDAVKNIVDFHFNRLTCENDMKWGVIHPDKNQWNFAAADAVAAYARARGIKMTGHTLIWHSQLPSNNWIFAGLTANTDKARNALKTIMKDHIDTIVERYYDVIDNWDVVNEAISDSGGYRTTSPWYQYFGSAEYIYWAFKYTKDALEAHEAGGSVGKLYYNDYSVENSTKLSDIINMVAWLRGLGATVDGVGTQAHWNLTWPGTSTIQSTINALANAGLKVKVSELDVSIYGSSSEPEKTFTYDLEQQQANRYADIFAVFRTRPVGTITSVTFWGVTDDQTWLDNFPVSGRNDYPLLFNDSHNAKLAYDAIINF